jgi:hypothetical protein
MERNENAVQADGYSVEDLATAAKTLQEMLQRVDETHPRASDLISHIDQILAARGLRVAWAEMWLVLTGEDTIQTDDGAVIFTAGDAEISDNAWQQYVETIRG